MQINLIRLEIELLSSLLAEITQGYHNYLCLCTAFCSMMLLLRTIMQ